MGRATSSIKATGEVYPELQLAYDHFNRRLFANVLPPCLITLNRGKNTVGYFSPKRFVRYNGEVTHEIAMNPAYFAVRSVKDTLSTLVHEQVHLWQETFGKASRHGYHNKEWAGMCEAVGLMPSATGQPGGAKVGEHMDHYIIEGGMFDRAADELLKEAFHMSWFDRFPAAVPRGLDLPPGWQPPDPVALKPPEKEEGGMLDEAPPDAVVVPMRPVLPKGLDLGEAAGLVAWPSDRRPKASKVKYRCAGCGNQVWGKSGMDLQCNPCDRPLSEAK